MNGKEGKENLRETREQEMTIEEWKKKKKKEEMRKVKKINIKYKEKR